jgi:hypothetical protein
VDLDGDGKTDILSGSWQGPITWFRRSADGFAGGATLKRKDGHALNPDLGTVAFAFDWDADSKLDLLVGTASGEVFFVRNVGTRREPVFGEPRPLTADGAPISIAQGDAAPAVADWDGDGRPDLIVGGGTGSVVWFRNVGQLKRPRLAASRVLVPPSPSPWRDDKSRWPGEWGVRARPCVVDWDGDGKLDLLVGDVCGGLQAKPRTTPDESAEATDATTRLPTLRAEWAAVYKQFAALSDAPEPADSTARAARRRQLARLRDTITRLRDEITRLQDVRDHYRPGYMYHGYVWLFRRTHAAK